MISAPFLQWLLTHYASTKSQSPNEGRRKLKLLVAEKFWAAGDKAVTVLSTASTDSDTTRNADFVTDSDPFDQVSLHGHELGVILRTDFSDEAAWLSFCRRLEEGEQEFAVSPSESEEHDATMDPDFNITSHSTDDSAITAEENDSSDSDDEDSLPKIFRIVNPSLSEEQTLLSNISNLSALRLFNDVDIRQAPSPPPGTKRISPKNRLIDSNGWQEVYSGKTLWIYDAKSNSDQCVRVVGQASSDMYGTATADSWRARVSHICELQVNLSSGVMRIDFGGLDRWDYAERQRNMQEAEDFVAASNRGF